MRKTLTALTGASLILLSLIAGCDNPLSFRFLGTQHYDGKRFLDLEGQFEAITLSTTGGRVAFRGRDNTNQFVLFVADLDGLAHKVASTGPSDGLVMWAGDGNSLYYMDLVLLPDGTLDGGTIQKYTLPTNTVQKALHAVSLIPFFPSPDGSRLLVAGQPHQAERVEMVKQSHLLTMADGSFVPIAPGHQPAHMAVWSPNGQRIAIAAAPAESEYGVVKMAIASAPEWNATSMALPTMSERFLAIAWEDDTVLRVVEIAIGDFLKVTRFGTDGQVIEATQLELDSPPDATRYAYSRPSLSPDGQRVLVTRQVLDIESSTARGPREHFVVDNVVRRPVAVQEDLEPVGWTGDGRYLFMSGHNQRKRPVLLRMP